MKSAFRSINPSTVRSAALKNDLTCQRCNGSFLVLFKAAQHLWCCLGCSNAVRDAKLKAEIADIRAEHDARMRIINDRYALRLTALRR